MSATVATQGQGKARMVAPSKDENSIAGRTVFQITPGATSALAALAKNQAKNTKAGKKSRATKRVPADVIDHADDSDDEFSPDRTEEECEGEAKVPSPKPISPVDLLANSPGFTRCNSNPFSYNCDDEDENVDVRIPAGFQAPSSASLREPSDFGAFGPRSPAVAAVALSTGFNRMNSNPVSYADDNEKTSLLMNTQSEGGRPPKSSTGSPLLSRLAHSLSSGSFTRHNSNPNSYSDDDISTQQEPAHEPAQLERLNSGHYAFSASDDATATSPTATIEMPSSPLYGLNLTDADIDALAEQICVDYTLSDYSVPTAGDSMEDIDINSLPTLSSIPLHWNIEPSYERSYSTPFNYEYYAEHYGGPEAEPERDEAHADDEGETENVPQVKGSPKPSPKSSPSSARKLALMQERGQSMPNPQPELKLDAPPKTKGSKLPQAQKKNNTKSPAKAGPGNQQKGQGRMAGTSAPRNGSRLRNMVDVEDQSLEM
eukprot:comp21647_c0_seq1/m.30424 comp21647_c0_seq1/g.30424  ORF comp21647_c0_seq1/g.30424 comp21647_c0_seq1/m.30424 type:complete len:487 (-) comp21647_c0_seq1:28-1488(-)